jgi:glycerophosphoryl diester phosphodiesterase
MFGPSITFHGVPAASLADPDSFAGADVVILGAPYDGGTSHRPGARFGPQAIRSTDYLPPDGSRPSLALGVDALEFDVHPTADGEPVVIHDATLDRTTTGHGPVRSITLARLQALKLLDRTGVPSTDTVPTLAQVLELARPTSVVVLPEIKLDLARAPYPDVEPRVVALLRAHGMLDRAVVQSFDDETLRRLRALAPALRTMLLINRVRMSAHAAAPGDVIRWAREAGATDLGVDFHLVDAALVAAARAGGIKLSVWTVNSDADLRRMAALGVDLIMTDRPDRARQLLVQP